MNTASELYSTALLITMSISYSRYFSTATPIATHRHKNARFDSTAATTESVTIDGMNVATTSTAAAANHFSCSRSSPADRANLTTTATALTTSAATTRIRIAASSSGLPAWLPEPNGSDHTPVACTSKTAPVKVNAPPTNHAAGRHRRERSRPAGKSKNTNASTAIGITQTQLDNQANAPPGRQRLAAWPRGLRGEPDAGGQLAGRASCGRA